MPGSPSKRILTFPARRALRSWGCSSGEGEMIQPGLCARSPVSSPRTTTFLARAKPATALEMVYVYRAPVFDRVAAEQLDNRPLWCTSRYHQVTTRRMVPYRYL